MSVSRDLGAGLLGIAILLIFSSASQAFPKKRKRNNQALSGPVLHIGSTSDLALEKKGGWLI
jgi:hypothetical protein